MYQDKEKIDFHLKIKDDYEKGVEHYLNDEKIEALDIFTKLAEEFPGEKSIEYYLKKI